MLHFCFQGNGVLGSNQELPICSVIGASRKKMFDYVDLLSLFYLWMQILLGKKSHNTKYVLPFST